MNREIKFRAWDKGSKRYGEVVEIEYNESREIDEVWVWYNIHERHDPIPGANAVVEQYTGVKDKNGKEIYEGDIVEEDIDFNSRMTDGTFRYKVYWNEDEFCWSLDPIGPESIHNDLWELNSSCRVIGNVHENKELLNGSD